MRRLVPLAIIAPALTLGGVVAASPAHAACDPGQLRTSLQDAALVVTGRVSEVEKLSSRQVYTVTVDRVYAGSSAATLKVQAPLAERPCAMSVKEGDDWLFLSQGTATTPVVRRDWGSTRLTAEAATVVADVLGSGTKPAADPGSPPEITLERIEGRTHYSFAQLALPGAVLAGAGVLLLLLARALGRSRR